MSPMIRFVQPTKGILVNRYKRFFADVRLVNSEIIIAHCPNTGKMLGLSNFNAPALLSHLNDPKRKLQYRLEALKDGDTWVGVNTQWPNSLIRQLIQSQIIPTLCGYDSLRTEVKYGHNSRIDILLEDHPSAPNCYVEVKNVHFSRNSGLAEFPDCVTTRGAKHVRALMDMVRLGYRACIVFCVQRDDVDRFSLARDIDVDFAKALDEAIACGVETIALSFGITEDGIAYSKPLIMA
jgi:sugar fermentation stimulation protein A